MNLNIYKRPKSFFQTKQRQKVLLKTNQKVLLLQHNQELFQEGKRIYLTQTNLNKAIQCFQMFLEMYPKHDEALYLCGVCEVQFENFESAALKFQKVSQNCPMKQNALLLASISYNKLGFPSRSFQLINTCIKRSPQYQEALCFRGKLYLQANNFLRAELDFKRVVQVNPKSFLGWVGLADCNKLTYHYQRAIELYEKSLGLLAASSNLQNFKVNDIHLKIGICYYLLEKYQRCEELLSNLSVKYGMKTSQLYYYLGICELQLNNKEKGLNHLQFAIRLDSNSFVVEKAYKKLIMIYLHNYQFYEAQTISRLVDSYTINSVLWRVLVDSLMMVIRHQFEEGLQGINRIYTIIKTEKQSFNQLRITDNDKKIDELIFRNQHVSNRGQRNYSALKGVKQNNIHQRSLDKTRKSHLFRINRSFDKAGSMRLHNNQYQSFPLKFGRFKTDYQQTEERLKQSRHFSENQKELLLPILLRFKAYSQFFLNQHIACSETLQQYELYIQHLLGQQSDVKFNKTIVQILLLVDGEQFQEALIKCNEAANIQNRAHSLENSLPLIYKIAILIRMAINNILKEQEHKDESYDILVLTLQMISEKQMLKKQPLIQQLAAIIYILIDDYTNSQQCLEMALTLGEITNPNIFFMKGLVQLKLGNYLVAFRDITSCLVIKQSANAYLARSLVLYFLSQDKQILSAKQTDLLVKSLDPVITLEDFLKLKSISTFRECIVEKCLDDLQAYIDFCQDQNQITTWVTKILFACGSYDEATAAIQKVTTETAEMNKISECLAIYNGDFQKGGKVGLTIKSSLDGKFLSQKNQANFQAIIPDVDVSQLDYIQAGYIKWLTLLQLYIKQQYDLCIVYLVKLIPQCHLEEEQLIMRFNLALIYFFNQQHQAAVVTIKSLSKFTQYDLNSFIERVLEGNFAKDECLSDIAQLLHIRSSKMLSSYLPYRSFSIRREQQQVGVFGRICVPFPSFPVPQLNLEFDLHFILQELDLNKFPKVMEAPWIRLSGNQCIQFTDHLQDTICSLESHQQNANLSLPLKRLSGKLHSTSPPNSLQ